MIPLIDWNTRYAQSAEEDYDWYVSSSELTPLITQFSGPEDEILYCGCGSSSLAFELHKSGRKFVTSIDSNEIVIRAMARKYSSYSDLQFLCLDATELPRDLTCAVNTVIDKGLLDTLLCETTLDSAKRYLVDVKRVLKPGGWFFVVSHGLPDSRVPLLVSCLGLVSPDHVSVGLLAKPSLPKASFDTSASPSHYFVYTVQTPNQ